MLVLENESLTVTLLDPEADRERLSTRYVCGGYIFQVEDKLAGPLLAVPDQLTDEEASAYSGGKIWEDGFNVQDGQEWEVSQSSSNSFTFTTEHDIPGQEPMHLVRTVTLAGRTVRSETSLVNTGGATVPIAWYPHPFFPQPEGDELLKFSMPVTVPADSVGYEVSPSGWISRKGWPWTGKDNHYQALGHSARGESFVVLHRHPKVGMIAAAIDYSPALLPIWGNPQTISWEPHLERTLASGQELRWTIEYEFGGGIKL